MKKKILFAIISYLVCFNFTFCRNNRTKIHESNAVEIKNIDSINSIIIFEEGWEVWGSIIVFKDKELYDKTSSIYTEETMLSGHGSGTDSFILSPNAFNYLKAQFAKTPIKTKIPYWNKNDPNYSLFIIKGNKIIKNENILNTKIFFEGYTFYPEETIKYYTNLKNSLNSSLYKQEYSGLILSIDEKILKVAYRQKKLSISQ